ncbi:DNA repair protein crb2 [Rhypophila sp. PSN 637]
MTNWSKGIQQVDKRADEEDNGDEGSQEVFNAHKIIYGVGTTRSSPPPREYLQLSKNKRGRQSSQLAPLAHQTRKTRDVNGIDHINPQGPVPACDPAQVKGDARVAMSSAPNGPRASQDAAQSGDMDSSQAATQANEGRSYDQYLGASSPGHALHDEAPSSPGGRVPASQHHSQLSNHIDPEHVIMDHGGTDRTVSSLPDESGLVDFGSLARTRPLETQAPPLNPPETPAAASNPFRQGRSQLLPPSQLFGATQFSSAVKLASPTSSRPSPNDFQHNSISPNPMVSSPLKARGLRSTPFANPNSSPQILPATTSPTRPGGSSSPIRTGSAGIPTIPVSSIAEPSRKRSVPEPMAEYVPMRESQERRSSSVLRSAPACSDDEHDMDDSIVRKRRVKEKKEAARKQLAAISFVPPRPDDVEVPSSNKRRQRNSGKAKLARRPSSHFVEGQLDTLDTVVDSQEKPPKSGRNDTSKDDESTQSDAEEHITGDKPVETEERQLPENVALGRADNSLDPIQGHDDKTIPETTPPEEHFGVRPNHRMSPPTLPLDKTPSAAVFQSSPPDLGKRPRKSRSSKPADSTSSPLSNPDSVTPPLPPVVTPVTDESVLADQSAVDKSISNSSPVVAKNKRRQAPNALSRSKLGSTESLRQSARSRRYSSSADELAASSRSGTPTFEQSLRVSRLSTSKSRSMTKPQQNERTPGLFEGMAFAISFQARHVGESNDRYNTRIEFSSSIEKKIKQAGGRILHNGFDELFDTSPAKAGPASPGSSRIESNINLTTVGKSTGFTALIADGHSRKVKYMQALALGLPCIATRWITTCLEKNQLVDWAPYLLCAGQSAFLGDAIRSRNLLPYSAETAKLTDIVDMRTKLLEGSRILLVIKKATEGKKMAYVFLARILGASLSRVYSVEEARAELKTAEDSGQPFDWVYVDGKADQVDLFTSAPSAGEKRKRKRTSTSAAPIEQQPACKKIRTLSDELVIQSLILGRLIEEGELDG